jgi:hypothetical protein
LSNSNKKPDLNELLENPNFQKAWIESSQRLAESEVRLQDFQINAMGEIKNAFYSFTDLVFIEIDNSDNYTHWFLGIYFLGVMDALLQKKGIIRYNDDNCLEEINEFYDCFIDFANIIDKVEQSGKMIYFDTIPHPFFPPSFSYRGSSLLHIYKPLLTQPFPMDIIRENNMSEKSVIYKNYDFNIGASLIEIFNQGRDDINNFSDTQKFSSNIKSKIEIKNSLLENYFYDIQQEIRANQRKNNTGCLSIFLPIIFLFQFFR